MLDITFGRTNCGNHRIIEDPRIFFKRYKEPWWFEDDFVKRFLLDIDKSTVLFEEALKDRWGRGISSSVISSGCKLSVVFISMKTLIYTLMGEL